jgi:bifunctional DNA-binding transcriptional regulator/antitoxin component of YhaV-PrlF toxin-antitoxin module
MDAYLMHTLDTITITRKGQATFPLEWRKRAGLMDGGPCDVRTLNDGNRSLLITPRVQKRTGAVGLLKFLRRQTVSLPPVKRTTLPMK